MFLWTLATPRRVIPTAQVRKVTHLTCDHVQPEAAETGCSARSAGFKARCCLSSTVQPQLIFRFVRIASAGMGYSSGELIWG